MRYQVLRSRKTGKDKAKLCVTLELVEVVDELLDSASLPRNAADQSARQTYFNRDLTKQEAQDDYNILCLAKKKALQSSTETTSNLNPRASFPI